MLFSDTMGLFNRIRSIFTSKPEAEENAVEEYIDPLHEEMSTAHAHRQESVISESLKVLDAEDNFIALEEKVESPPAEYDAGEVEVSDLLLEDDKEVDHSTRNVVEHDSIDDLGDHLEHASIVGDLPEEVAF